MAFPIGGRADKLGNRYEGRWLVLQCIRLLREEIQSVTIELIGDDEIGVDIRIINKDNSVEFHQCKARNGSKIEWTLADLNKRDILNNAKLQLDKTDNLSFHLVSPFNVTNFSDIIDRAKNSISADIFYEHQILKSGSATIQCFKNFVSYLNLNIKNKDDIEKAYNYIKRISIDVVPDSTYQKDSLLNDINFLFIGNKESIYSLIKDFAIENNYLGKEIIAPILSKYLINKGYDYRELRKDEKILPKIRKLNTLFKDSFVPINETMIKRNETQDCLEQILHGNSVIIHGRAGFGKSGCIQELIDSLEENNTNYLAIKLDTRIPEKTAEKFGDDIGLPASPVLCLDAISKQDNAVLILDQLDALHWTNKKSSTSLDVIKEMIYSIQHINISRTKKISIVFVCRTFDLENDNGLKNLFVTSEESNNIDFIEIEIDKLLEKDVKTVIGSAYNSLSLELIELLKIPSNLYIWTKLNENLRKETYRTSIDLIRKWWDQLKAEFEDTGGKAADLEEFKDSIIERINSQSEMQVPITLLNKFSVHAKDYLLSNGLFITDKYSLKFTHQSYYEFFIVDVNIQNAIEGNSIIDIIGSRERQIPIVRYQLQMLLEHFLHGDIDRFLMLGHEILGSDSIRYYIKFVFIEVLGQVDEINKQVEEFIIEYLNNDLWREAIIDAVIFGRQIFIELLINKGYIQEMINSSNNQDLGFSLLRSVNNVIPDVVVEQIEPFVGKDKDTTVKVYYCLCRHIEDDSENMFDLRIKLLLSEQSLFSSYFFWKKVIEKKPFRAIRLIETIVKSGAINNKRNLNFMESKDIKNLCVNVSDFSEYIWDQYMPYLSEETKDMRERYSPEIEKFITQQYMNQVFGRAFVELIKSAAASLINHDAKKFLKLCERYYDNTSIILNEIFLTVMFSLPVMYSDYVVSWLLGNLEYRLFEYSSNNDEHLTMSKQVIEKHSRTCSDELFNRLEEAIYYFHSKEEIDSGKRKYSRLAGIREDDKKPNYEHRWVYWGDIQYALLPILDASRISVKSKELLRVLSRKSSMYFDRYTRNRVEGGSVISTISKVADKLPDKKWLKIIRNQNLSINRSKKWIYDNNSIKESTHRQFANDFERVGKLNPKRFAELALGFPEEVNEHYIYALFTIIGHKDDGNNITYVDIILSKQLFVRFLNVQNYNIVSAFCRAIEQRSNEEWGTEIYDLLIDIAISCPNPSDNELNVIPSEDKEGEKISTIEMNSINCGRGCAANTIASLIHNDNNRYVYFVEAINSLVYDAHLSVNIAAIECIRAAYNIDKEKSEEWFFALAKKDLRLVAGRRAYHLFYSIYTSYSFTIKKLIKNMYNSKYDDVSETGSRHITNFYLIHNCFYFMIFFHKKKSDKKIEGMLDVVTQLIKNEEYYEKCIKILSAYENNPLFMRHIGTILLRKEIDINRDMDFIIRLSKNKNVLEEMNIFLEFIEQNDLPIEKFSEAIFEICNNIIANGKEDINNASTSLYGAGEKLSSLVTVLYSRTLNDFTTNQKCLDMWDMMFEHRIGTIRELTSTINLRK